MGAERAPFAVIHGDGPKHDKSFYSMRKADNVSRLSKLTTLKAKQTNALFWSPAGQFTVLAWMKGFSCQLEFCGIDDLETMATKEHFMATYVMWDPTGRFVGIAVTSVDETKKGFRIWSFVGSRFIRCQRSSFTSSIGAQCHLHLVLAGLKKSHLNLRRYIKKAPIRGIQPAPQKRSIRGGAGRCH